MFDLYIEDGQIIYVKHLVNAKDMKEALKAVLKRWNLSSNLILLRKLYSQTLNEGGDMVNHV